MSKIGKKKILIPKEVNISINGDNIDIKGPYGHKKINIDTKLFEVNISENKELSIKPKKKNDDTKKFINNKIGVLGLGLSGVSAVKYLKSIGKEVYDSFYPDSHTVDINDALSTAAGGLVHLNIIDIISKKYNIESIIFDEDDVSEMDDDEIINQVKDSPRSESG